MIKRVARQDPYNVAMCVDPGRVEVRIGTDKVAGVLPQELRGGTWWGNGPAGLGRTGRVVHPYDGHGYLRAMRFHEDGTCDLVGRYVGTAVWNAERAAGRLLFDGYATQAEVGRRTLFGGRIRRNVANSCVLAWGGRLLALWHGGLPHVVDPQTLETLGLENFDGALYEEDIFLARTRHDVDRGVVVGLSLRLHGREIHPVFRELDARGQQVASVSIGLRPTSAIYDFVITRDWYVWTETPVRFKPAAVLRYMLGLGPALSTFVMSGENTRLILAPRRSGQVRVLDTGRVFQALHHAQAWQEGERVVLITCGAPARSFGRELGYLGPKLGFEAGGSREVGPELLRVEVGPGATRAQTTVVGDLSLDLPAVAPGHDGKRVRHVFGQLVSDGAGRALGGLGHVDLESRGTERWLAPPGVLVGEPILVPRAGARCDGDGWLLVMLTDGAARRSTWCVFDAAAMTEGPVYRAELPVFLPYGAHGAWVGAGQ